MKTVGNKLNSFVVTGVKPGALTPDNALSFTLGGNFIEVERFPKKGDAVKYGCSRLSGRSLKDFINK